jgi:hypothetical protein
VNAGTSASLGKPKQPGMGNIPAPIEILNISICDGNLMPSNQFTEGPKDRLGQVSIE